MTKITNDQVDFDQVDFIVGIWNQFTDTQKITMMSDFADECRKEDPDISREELRERIKEFIKEKGWDDDQERTQKDIDMRELTNEDIDFMRDDMESDYGYTKIIMISEFADECKKENPDISREELWEKIREFRKERGWDPEDDDDEN